MSNVYRFIYDSEKGQGFGVCPEASTIKTRHYFEDGITWVPILWQFCKFLESTGYEGVRDRVIKVKDGVDLSYLTWVGKYLAEKKPDVIVQIGDFSDMPSLSSYDIGKKSFEGRRYKTDIEVTRKAMELLLAPIKEYNERARRNKDKQYRPRMVLTLGNHEERISRAVEGDPKLDGTISLSDLKYEHYGWEVIPYLEPIVIDGVVYAHYFTSGVMGRPVTSAAALLSKKHMSAVMGHVQNRQIAYANRADGSQITGLFSGCCYLHDEDYLGSQGNKYWRGIWMLHEVNNGSFDEMPVSLNYLRKKYEH